jgi:hypothetical protein
MTHLQKLEFPISLTLTAGNWDIIHGLVTKEWAEVGRQQRAIDCTDRSKYLETLMNIRRAILKAQEKAGVV